MYKKKKDINSIKIKFDKNYNECKYFKINNKKYGMGIEKVIITIEELEEPKMKIYCYEKTMPDKDYENLDKLKGIKLINKID